MRPGADRVVLAAAAAFLLLAPLAHAHTWLFAGASAEFDAQGNYRLRLRFDVPAYLLNDIPARVSDADMNALLDGPPGKLDEALARARRRFEHGFRVRADGRESAGTLADFPTRAKIQEWLDSAGSPRLPVMLTLEVTGSVPAAARDVQIRFPEAIGDVVVSFDLPGGMPQMRDAKAGKFTEPVAVRLQPPSAEARAMGFLDVAKTYLVLGYEHILPKGLDHILFVLGIFLLGSRLGGLLWQVTAFTVAHSITLALSLYGVLRLPPAVVEPVISASIAFICVENLFAKRVTPWRVGIVFCFGLIHGLGFAGVLEELGLPRSQFVTALVTFNVGVELGQISVLALAFLAVGWWRDKPWYRTRVAMPASVLIACVGLYWTAQRVGWMPS